MIREFREFRELKLARFASRKLAQFADAASSCYQRHLWFSSGLKRHSVEGRHENAENHRATVSLHVTALAGWLCVGTGQARRQGAIGAKRKGGRPVFLAASVR